MNEQPEQPKENGFTIEEWIAADPVTYDAMGLYQEHLHALIDQFHNKCVELDIPYHLTVVVKVTEEGNSALKSMHMCGPEKATPDIIFLAANQRFSGDTTELAAQICKACQEKYGRIEDEKDKQPKS